MSRDRWPERRPLCFVSVALTRTPYATGGVSPWLPDLLRIGAISLIRREDGTRRLSNVWVDDRLFLNPHLSGMYTRRTPDVRHAWLRPESAAAVVATVTQGTYMIGLDIAETATALTLLLASCGLQPPWYASVDVGAEVGAMYGLPLHRRRPPDLANALGIDMGGRDRMALTDAAAEAEFAEHAFDTAWRRRHINAYGIPNPSPYAARPAGRHLTCSASARAGIDADDDIPDDCA